MVCKNSYSIGNFAMELSTSGVILVYGSEENHRTTNNFLYHICIVLLELYLCSDYLKHQIVLFYVG